MSKQSSPNKKFMPTQTVTIYLYEPHPSVQRALVDRLDHVPGIELVGFGRAPHRAARQTRLLKPDVVIAGLRPSDQGLPLWLRAAARRRSGPCVVALDTSYDAERRQLVEVSPHTVYLVKGLDVERLVEQIHKAACRRQEEAGKST